MDGKEDKLVEDPKMNLVAMHTAKVVGGIWVNVYHKTGVGWRKGDIKPLRVISVTPLRIALACKKRDTYPLPNDIGPSRDVHRHHNRLAVGKSG